MNRWEQIDRLEELFHKARGLDREERARFIEEVRLSDPELCNELESLVSAHEDGACLIDLPAYDAAASLMVEKDLAGSSIDHYYVSDLIGKGGMGEVYRARDTRLGREVALKVLPEAFAGDSGRLARFQREARVLASLNHPGIAGIYDLIECNGKHVLVLEMIEGETLADKLRLGALPLHDVLEISTQIAEALSAAHKKGVVHRDLKPANIKITPEGRVKVLDFGLAKQFPSGDNGADSSLDFDADPVSVSGAVFGTPAYMSPEQALGQVVDARSDVFSFGAVLYELLTGSRPFLGKGLPALLHSVLTTDPVSPRRIRSEIPAGLETIAIKALHKSREQRQQSMDEICDDLARLNARRIGTRSKTAASLTERLHTLYEELLDAMRKHKRAVLLAAGLFAVSFLCGVVWLIARRANSNELRGAALTFTVEKASAYELFQQGLVYLERWDIDKNLDDAFHVFNAALTKDKAYAPAYAGLGTAYVLKYRNNRDKSMLELAVQNAKQAVELDGHIAVSRVSLGRAYVARGEYALGETELKEALMLDPLNADAYRIQADIERAKANWNEAERLYQKAVELRPENWNLHYALGLLYYRLSRFAEAERSIKEAIDLAPDCFMIHRDLGAVYHLQGRFEEASAEFQRSLQIRPSAATYSNLGTSLFFQGLYQQSVAAMEKAVDLGANNYQTWANLGDAYRQTTGNEEKAHEAFQAAIQLVRGELSANSKDANMRSQLAVYLAKSGEKQEALSEASRAEALDQSAPVLATLVLVYEICDKRELALNALAGALKKGHSIEEISRDPELLHLRQDSNYRRLVVKLSNAPQK